MPFITPYVTDKYTAYLGEVVSTSLSMAVWIIDDYTKKRPIGHIRVMIEEGKINATRNPGDYYLFTDLAPGSYDVGIRSDLYFPVKETVDTSVFPDPGNPVVEINVKPRPSYPFPANSTLIRGLVSNTGPVVNAEISVTGKSIQTETDEKGEFVLYFRGIKEEDISIVITKNGDTRTVDTTVEEGKTVSLGKISFP